VAARLSAAAAPPAETAARSPLACEAITHPVFDPLRFALEPLAREGGWPDAERLNALAAELGVGPRNARGLPVRFVAPAPDAPGYELSIFATGCVPTRPRNLHDLFNALAWLAFPRTKAALNALHADEIPREGGRRGPFRDLLTLIDEGGALVACADPALAALVREFRWQELFWDARERVRRDLRIAVVGHAVLEKALAPWPGITCKAVFVELERAALEAPVAELVATLDSRAAGWLERLSRATTPRELPPLPVFGYPGWYPGSDDPAFYADERYFRPYRKGARLGALEERAGPR
jgi:hypothetical protein